MTRKSHQEYLVEIFDHKNQLTSRRIASSKNSANRWVRKFADNLDAKVHDNADGMGGSIVTSRPMFSYSITNISVVRHKKITAHAKHLVQAIGLAAIFIIVGKHLDANSDISMRIATLISAVLFLYHYASAFITPNKK